MIDQKNIFHLKRKSFIELKDTKSYAKDIHINIMSNAPVIH